MMTPDLKDNIKVTDSLGFIYEVVIQHFPDNGVSIAYHRDKRIASREYGRMKQPHTDDDKEWEEWQERFSEWTDHIMEDLKLECKRYFEEHAQTN